MTKTATLTLRVSQEVKDKLVRLAGETDRTPSAVAQRALSAYIDQQVWMLAEIEKSREDFREGRVVPNDEVMRQADEILSRHKSKAA